ncbi:hypothetical protein CC2G_007202 [Coprinopsis cinerea AmutBmut pab1-1]|nr:hypothetical protein CC2G_007202 [Coprinopsis cinerea AmutBmut pab1-1]
MSGPSNPTTEYPEQLHSGAIGIGPHYHTSPGLKEEVKGKIQRNPGKVQHGKDIRTGEELKRQREADAASDPFHETPSRVPNSNTGPHRIDTQGIGSLHSHDEKAHKEIAATVAPEGSEKSEYERKGEAVDRVKF